MDITLEHIFSGNTKYYVEALLVVVLGIIVLLAANIALKRRIKKLEEQSAVPGAKRASRSLQVLKFFKRIALPLIFLGILSVAINMISFDEHIQSIVRTVFAFIMTIIIVRSINKAMELAFSRYFEKDWANHELEKSFRPLLSFLKLVLWIVGFIILFANLGYDVSAAIAGLGIGGIAVAIAAQGILGDLFSYFVIFLDKPFELGDFIIFDDKLGVVEKIGIKSSRIRVLSGEILVVSNSDLTSTRIHNYRQMVRRRVVFTIGVPYQTSLEHIEEIPSIIRAAIESVQRIAGVVCDRSHFQAFGNFSLNFETVYYVPTADYNIYMDVQQEIYQKIFRAFKEKEIEFAYPTQKIYTVQELPSQTSLVGGSTDNPVQVQPTNDTILS